MNEKLEQRLTDLEQSQRQIADFLQVLDGKISIGFDTIDGNFHIVDQSLQSINSQITTINNQIETITSQIGTITSQIGTITSQIGTINSQFVVMKDEFGNHEEGTSANFTIVNTHLEKISEKINDIHKASGYDQQLENLKLIQGGRGE